jgi:YVTN family beta-propeller protein
VDLPSLPPGFELPAFYPHTVNHGLALSPDEKLLFAAGSIADYVAVYTVPGLRLITTIPVGDEPNWIEFSSDGRFAYVSNRLSDTVSVIHVGEMKVEKEIAVGKYPQRMRVATLPMS